MTVDLQAATDEMDRRARRNVRLALAGDEIEAALRAVSDSKGHGVADTIKAMTELAIMLREVLNG